MPSFTIHLAVAKKYLEKHLQENEEQFYNGVIDPDLKDKAASHFGRYSSTPDLNKYCREVGLNTSYSRGYFLHLLTDDLFYNKFLDEFSSEIYKDYDKLNRELINKYNLEIPNQIKGYIKFEEGDTKLLDFEKVCKFIDSVGNIELENYREETKESQGQEFE